MVKSKMVYSSSKATPPYYPRIMIYTRADIGLVVLFTDTKCGVVLQCNSGAHSVGYADDDWQMSMFKDISGSLEMSNA